MKIEKTPNLGLTNKVQNNSKQSNPTFKGAGLDAAFNFLQTNQAVGATVVDVSCMGLPRTAVDFTRSPQAGVETARREFTSTINDGLMGVYGMGATALLANGLNREYGLNKSVVKANNLSIDNNALDILADLRINSGDLKNEKNLENFLAGALENTKVFNPNSKDAKSGLVSISDDVKNEIIKNAKQEILGESSDKKTFNSTVKRIKDMLISDTGVEAGYKLEKNVKVSDAKTVLKTSESSVDDYVSNLLKAAKTFSNEKVSKAFDASKSVGENAFIKSIKGLNSKATVLGIGLCAGIGLAAQPINVYLTKKKTGTSGFVGGGEKDKSLGFKLLKTAVAVAAMTGALASISKGKFKEIPEALKFKGALPTIPQFKFVYGMTIFSRLMSARNKDELREGAIKDSLGFVNWLILGGFVQKFAAMGFEKVSKGAGKTAQTYLKRPVDVQNPIKRFLQSEVVSRNEVLHDAMKKLGKSTIGADGKALRFKEMHKVVTKAIKDGQLDNAFKGKLKALNFIQLAGYAYSGLVLGIGVPKLNIAITNHFRKKAEAQKQAQQA